MVIIVIIADAHKNTNCNRNSKTNANDDFDNVSDNNNVNDVIGNSHDHCHTHNPRHSHVQGISKTRISQQMGCKRTFSHDLEFRPLCEHIGCHSSLGFEADLVSQDIKKSSDPCFVRNSTSHDGHSVFG